MERTLSDSLAAAFEAHLLEEEKSRATIEKYMRDIRCFAAYIREGTVDRAAVLAYKAALLRRYAVSSANSMLAALNAFFCFAGWDDLRIRLLRVQRQAYVNSSRELDRQEYERLVQAAGRAGNVRLQLILQTICATGIRVSELAQITAESVTAGEATVRCKGKTRRVFLVRGLRRLLQDYIRRRKIRSGPVFLTRGGRPVTRTMVWREMKGLCRAAHVNPEKVFPHNLRHLFARIFYGKEKDIAKLADILGHSSINTTRIYIITTGEEHRRLMEDMSLIVQKAGGEKRAKKKPVPARAGRT